MEVTDQEIDGAGHTKTARGPASEPSWNSALVLGRPGVHPVSSVIGLVRPRAGSDPPLLVPMLGDGGDEETRTPDPLLAKEMLCQLSYVPSGRNVCGGRFWTRTRDLCLIRAVL